MSKLLVLLLLFTGAFATAQEITAAAAADMSAALPQLARVEPTFECPKLHRAIRRFIEHAGRPLGGRLIRRSRDCLEYELVRPRVRSNHDDAPIPLAVLDAKEQLLTAKF